MPTVKNHLEALKSCDGITIESTDLNKHPDLLGTKSGIVDLETGTLKDKYDPALLITHSTGLPYEPEKAYPIYGRNRCSYIRIQ